MPMLEAFMPDGVTVTAGDSRVRRTLASLRLPALHAWSSLGDCLWRFMPSDFALLTDYHALMPIAVIGGRRLKRRDFGKGSFRAHARFSNYA